MSSGIVEVIQSPKLATKQEHRRAYRRKHSARGPPVVEPSITSPCSSFTDCDTDSLASIDSVAATNNYEKVGVTGSALPI